MKMSCNVLIIKIINNSNNNNPFCTTSTFTYTDNTFLHSLYFSTFTWLRIRVLPALDVVLKMYPVKDLIERRSALRQFAPALLHQLDALQRSLVGGHRGPAHGRRLLHLTDDLWWGHGADGSQITSWNMLISDFSSSSLTDTHPRLIVPACSTATLWPPPPEGWWKNRKRLPCRCLYVSSTGLLRTLELSRIDLREKRQDLELEWEHDTNCNKCLALCVCSISIVGWRRSLSSVSMFI